MPETNKPACRKPARKKAKRTDPDVQKVLARERVSFATSLRKSSPYKKA